MPLPPDQPPPQEQPPQFYPVHPEFGYLVPALPFRRKAWLACKATALGAVLGAVAMIALWPDRDAARVEPMLVMEALAAPVDTDAAAPAVPAIATPATSVPGYSLASTSAVQPVPPSASVAPAEQDDVAPPTPPAKSAPPKAKKKQATRRKPQDLLPPAEVDARNAYAARFGHTFQQPRREWNGWHGGYGGRSYGW